MGECRIGGCAGVVIDPRVVWRSWSMREQGDMWGSVHEVMGCME